MGRRRNRRSEFDDVLMPLPRQIEGVFLCVIPLAFGFGIWQIIDEVTGKAELYSQAFGIPVDFMPAVMSMSPWIALAAGVFAVKVYWKCRRWFVRKVSAVG